jgi:hypothetical protein
MIDHETPSFQEDKTDRRTSTRVRFGAVLGVAELAGESIPPRSEFRIVKAVNLSHTGISFATSEWPRNDRLVVMLGDSEAPNYVITRIVGCVSKDRGEGHSSYKVHCEFVEWLTTTE